jgi:hypothetical protein
MNNNKIYLTNRLGVKANPLEETISSGFSLRTHESKKNAAIGAIAVSMAKKNKDPLYNVLKMHREAWKRAKNDIVMRYQSQAEMKFQKKQAGI